MVGSSPASPKYSTPPNHSSSGKEIDRGKRVTTFGRNRRTSRLVPASRAISLPFSEAISDVEDRPHLPNFDRPASPFIKSFAKQSRILEPAWLGVGECRCSIGLKA